MPRSFGYGIYYGKKRHIVDIAFKNIAKKFQNNTFN
jgi:hypothetical protein